MTGMRRREALAGYLFLLPAAIGFMVFIAGPMLYAFRISLFEWNIFQPAKYVGLENYRTLLDDARVWTGFKNTAMFTLIVVPLDIIVALALAVALQQKIPRVLKDFFRTSFLLPVVTSIAAISIVLRFMLSTRLGVVNYYLGVLGIEAVRWLDSSQWALISIALATVWKTFGFDLLLFSAGIQNIPGHLYEAAEIDGAGAWAKFRYVTLPQLSPTIFFVTVIGIIGNSQVFDQANIMTAGGPGDSTTTIVMVIWEKLSSVKYGYGSSIAAVFFMVILLLTILQFWFSRRWVYYEGGDA